MRKEGHGVCWGQWEGELTGLCLGLIKHLLKFYNEIDELQEEKVIGWRSKMQKIVIWEGIQWFIMLKFLRIYLWMSQARWITQFLKKGV